MEEKPLRVVGTMSGTSLDGVDAAEIITDGVKILALGRTAYRPYSDTEQAVLRRALGGWPGDRGVAEATRIVEIAHAEVLAQFPDAELIGFHGQTLAHDPGGRGTHQAGDGAALAQALGTPVAWDFRSADVVAGGQGAPLAPVFHFALARWIGADAPLVFLNLGGVGNLTWLDPTAADPFASGAMLAFDTGPANAPINDLVADRTGAAYDADGALSTSGTVKSDLLETYRAMPYFARPPPKSLDRDDFAGLARLVADLSDADAAATLAYAAGFAVGQGISLCPARPARLLITGGGRHNPALMHWCGTSADMVPEPVEAAGLDGDMIEAQAFAYLAMRTLRGLPITGPGTTGVARPMTGGCISTP